MLAYDSRTVGVRSYGLIARHNGVNSPQDVSTQVFIDTKNIIHQRTSTKPRRVK
jgi:hypothetical protein